MTKEQLAEQHCNREGLSWENEYAKESFLAGFEAAQPKWISVEEELPDNDRTVIIKIFDYRRPKEKVTEVGLGYFDQEEKEWYYTSDQLVNSGHGWMITHYMEIP